MAVGPLIGGFATTYFSWRWVFYINIPFGIASFRLAGYVIWPFGRTVVWQREAGVWSVIGNVIWVIVVGWELAIAHLVAGLLLFITIIGIPLGIANFKLIPVSLLPLGKEIVPTDRPFATRY